MNSLTEKGDSLREQIRNSLVNSIENGSLAPGAVLPPTRELARQLGVSRDTVTRSYADLQSLHYIASSSTRGYYVLRTVEADDEALPSSAAIQTKPAQLSAYANRIAQQLEKYPFSPDYRALNFGGPPHELLPLKRWRGYMQEAASNTSYLEEGPKAMGQRQLRKAITGFLARAKQIRCKADDIAVFSNTICATNLFVRLLLSPHQAIAVEEPGFGGIKNVAYELGIETIGIPIDNEGLKVDVLNNHKNIGLVYVTPAHHDPTGVQMSLARRQQLLDWAERNDCWIIEDDFDGYFQYGRSSLPCLRAMDQNLRVIYISTFWKLLYPLTTLGFCLVPPSLLELVKRSKAQTDGLTELVGQVSLASMIEDGSLERHIRHLRQFYGANRTALSYWLTKFFGASVITPATTSGTHSVFRFNGFDRNAIITAGRKAGIPIISSEPFYLHESRNDEVIINFSCLKEDEIGPSIERLAGLLRT